MGRKGVSKRKPSQKKSKELVGEQNSNVSSLVHDSGSMPEEPNKTLKTGFSTKSDQKSTADGKFKSKK
jgi:hypothetical protein